MECDNNNANTRMKPLIVILAILPLQCNPQKCDDNFDKIQWYVYPQSPPVQNVGLQMDFILFFYKLLALAKPLNTAQRELYCTVLHEKSNIIREIKKHFDDFILHRGRDFGQSPMSTFKKKLSTIHSFNDICDNWYSKKGESIKIFCFGTSLK